MKLRTLTVFFIVLLLSAVFAQRETVLGQFSTEYLIKIETDGSATWSISQTGTDIQVSTDTLYEFRDKVASLLEAAKNETGREMSFGKVSLTYNVSGSYVVVEYKFQWENFSKFENASMIIGDIFGLENFFLRLYDDGRVRLEYPEQYVIESVSPTPYEQNLSPQTLEWLGTIDFNAGEPNIVLREKSPSLGILEFIRQNAILITGVVMTCTGLSAGFYVFRCHKKKKIEAVKRNEPQSFPQIESDEDRILKLLKSSGGSLHQSVIADQCKFSKAKTSQLLAALEDQRMISRYKKGRDKVVVLQAQGET